MSSVEELKKLKELLDNSIITQEDFEEKKKQLLGDGVLSEDTSEVDQKNLKPRKISKALTRKIIIAASVIALLIVGYFGATKIIEHNKEIKLAAAVEEEIRPIMAKYGLGTYSVKAERYIHVFCDVYAEGFEYLTKGEALECLKELDSCSIDDPDGDGEIDFGLTKIHPGLDVEYYYWRVSSVKAAVNEVTGIGYTTPGLYCNRNDDECIYACKN